MELEQVGAEHHLQRTAGVERQIGGRARGDGTRSEEELSVGHTGLEADLSGPRFDELPVGEVYLRDVVVHGPGVADLADRDLAAARQLAGDVGVGLVLVGLGVASSMHPMRRVVCAHNNALSNRVVVTFEAGDLALEQRLVAIGGTATRRDDGDLDLLADGEAPGG